MNKTQEPTCSLQQKPIYAAACVYPSQGNFLTTGYLTTSENSQIIMYFSTFFYLKVLIE